MSNTLETRGSLAALKMAIKNRVYPDRGLQYCSNENQKTLSNKKLRCSVTESYDPY